MTREPTLSTDELLALVTRVFVPRAEDTDLAVLVDLPDQHTPDTPVWARRRAMASAWAEQLAAASDALGRQTRLLLYRNVRMNNADLPATAVVHPAGAPLPHHADALDASRAEPMDALLARHSLLLAPTQFSATAPLKLDAARLGFRAATMPGFNAAMIPALRLDYTEINRRVELMKGHLDRAEGADLRFEVQDGPSCALHLDLRHRTAHASGGLFPDPGTAGNLPSGETYIVPYEGEQPDVPSGSEGTMPVQFGDEVVVYTVVQNRAVSVDGAGPAALAEGQRLEQEPAYGNLAELGLGVLADFGLEPTGELLLDEKLGLHIAFGRSDHFGGQTGAALFSSPESVVHIDRVYLPSMQPRVRVRSVDLTLPGSEILPLIRDDAYVVDWNG